MYKSILTYCLFDEYGLHIEDYFRHMICMERKRTERSKSPFLLILLNIRSIIEPDDYTSTLKGIASVLLSSTREVDIKGWYDHGSTLGIIISGIDNTEIDKVIHTLYNRIHKGLCEVIGREFLNKIKISFHTFPEKYGDYNMNNPVFYHDIERQRPSRRFSLKIKRIIDILGSAFFLIVFSHIIFIIAILTKVSSNGPILFKQERIGFSGKSFIILKFRSMYENSNINIHKKHIESILKRDSSSDVRSEKELYTYKIEKDPRITPIGKIIRKTSLDELPQLINVLKGEMSLVGPRPPLPYEFAAYDLWHQRRVFEVKPGITGLWQVKRRSDTAYDEMVRLDLQYAKAWSLWLDLKILFRTPWAIANFRHNS